MGCKGKLFSISKQILQRKKYIFAEKIPTIRELLLFLYDFLANLHNIFVYLHRYSSRIYTIETKHCKKLKYSNTIKPLQG